MKQSNVLKNNICYWLVLACLFILPTLQAQDIEAQIQDIKKRVEEPFKLNGGLNASTSFNYTQGIQARSTPFSYRLNGNLLAQVFGVSIPISLNYSNGATVFNYRLPSYTFVGLSPSYKWATLHVGDRSLNFSPYTLAGHSFRGVGMEMKPGKFYFGAMYGRLKKATENDIGSLQSLDPSYKRMGYGIKAGYDSGQESLALILFKAWDDPNSNDFLNDSLAIAPAENAILSVIGKKQFGKVISVSVDFARSAFTRNRFSSELTGNINQSIFHTFGGLINPKTSTGFHHAIKSGLDFKTKFGNIQLQHEWVDPGYRTLGALFFNNDFENFTIGGNTNILKKKVKINSNIGVQRNNLKATRASASKRLIGSVQLNWMPNQKTNLALNYSNFKTTNKLRAVSVPFVLVDSIVLSQVNQNINFTVSKMLGTENTSSIMAMIAYNNANSIENDEVIAAQASSNLMGTIAFTKSIPQSKLTFASSLLGTYSQMPQTKIVTVAPTISISKPFFNDALKVSCNVAYTNVFNYGKLINGVFTFRTNMNFTLLEKHQISFNAGLIHRNQNTGKPGTQKSFADITGGLNYNWKFGGKDSKKK